MSALSDHERGIFRMASDVGYALDWVVEFKAGQTLTRRKIDHLTIEVEFTVRLEDASLGRFDPARWYERHRVTITSMDHLVFEAWLGRSVGTEEPNAGVVTHFLPGPWETLLANLWNAERRPS